MEVVAADYIEHFYNPERLHSSIDYLAPEAFEALSIRNPPGLILKDVARHEGSRSNGSPNGIRTRASTLRVLRHGCLEAPARAAVEAARDRRSALCGLTIRGIPPGRSSRLERRASR